MTDYKYNVKIGDKKINFRKWKVKDKKNFTQKVKENDISGSSSLVYDCIEDPSIPLTEQEFKWVLLNIRSKSIGDSVNYTLDCSECENLFEYVSPLTEIMTPEYEKFGIIKSGNVSFEMAEVANKEYYDAAIEQCTTSEETFFIDFMYHVKKFNGSDAFTSDTLYEFINDLDLDVGEDIFRKWNKMKFTLNDVKNVKCPHCGFEENYKFDVLPEFFPDSWFE